MDHDAIRQLFAKYAHGNDIRDAAYVGTTFTEKVDYRLSIAGKDAIEPIDNRADMVAFMKGALDAQTDIRKHVITNIRVVEETDDSAEVDAYLTLLVTDEGVPSLKCTGLYTTRIQQQPNGELLFIAMDLKLDSGF